MKILITIFWLFIFTYGHSQLKIVEFGDLSDEDRTITSYEKDPEANAVILYDKGKSVFYKVEDGYNIRYSRHKRIKIFDKSESKYAEISIPYHKDGYGRKESIDSIQAITYVLKNGRFYPKRLDPRTIYEEQISEHTFTKKFVFPDVQDGSIIEYKYVLESPFYFALPDWRFQDEIPTIYSEYEVRMIPFYEYKLYAQGISKFDYTTSYATKKERQWGNITTSHTRNLDNGFMFKDKVYHYVLNDIPAFKDESFITSVNDYIIKMNFQLATVNNPDGYSRDIISTWPELNKALLKNEDFGKYIKGSSRYARKILENELNITKLNESKKAQTIIEYVKRNYEWDGYYSKYASKSPKEFFLSKTGNVADINLFLIAMLKEAEIEVHPIVLSTRDYGKMPIDYPFSKFTNYVIVLVNTSSPFMADATEYNLRYNMVPTRCLNELGLIVNKEDESQWVGLGSKITSLENHAIFLTVDTLTLDLKTTVSIQSTNYEAYSKRNKLNDDIEKIKEFYYGKLDEVEKVKTNGFDSNSKTYSISLIGSNETERLGESIIIKPFLKFAITKNFLQLEKRTYPVDLVYLMDKHFVSRLEIPDGYIASDLPEGYELDDELMQIKLDYNLTKNTLFTTGNYTFKKAVYYPEEYASIKKHIDEIVRRFNDVVLLEKKS